MEFVNGALAGMSAGFFSNPLEVLKTRMQLQGELRARGEHPVHYRNILHASYTIVRNDGLLALQKGLVPALIVQSILNGTRLGIYQFADERGFTKDQNGQRKFHKALLTAGTAATFGHVIANPVFMIKTHLQAQAVSSIAVGHQHEHTGTWQALKHIYMLDGIKGLYRGTTSCIPRSFLGGSSQLLSFEYSKDYLITMDYFKNKSLLTAFVASMIGGVVVTFIMTPLDLILTRIYNQPTTNGKGQFYTGYFDCVSKIYRTEGFLAFYKGMGPVYFRIGPHTVLTLVFWDYLRKLQAKFVNNNT